MTKTLFVIFSILSFSTVFSQNISDKTGDIEISYIPHFFERNSNFEYTNKVSNKKNKPSFKMYFNSEGTLLKTIGFGKQHNPDLTLMDKICLFNYHNNRKIEIIEYECDYEKNIYPYWKTKFTYNEKAEQVNKSVFYYDNDSLFQKTSFEYDVNSNLIKIVYTYDYFLKYEFDSINRMKSYSQFYDGKLRWSWNYTYQNNQKTGLFQSYYGDDKNYSKQEISTYNEAGLLISFEEKYISKEGIDYKTLFFYEKNNIIKRIESYMAFSGEEYQLTFYADVKIKTKIHLTDTAIRNISNEFNQLNEKT